MENPWHQCARNEALTSAKMHNSSTNVCHPNASASAKGTGGEQNAKEPLANKPLLNQCARFESKGNGHLLHAFWHTGVASLPQ
jgi:hypothetical protein